MCSSGSTSSASVRPSPICIMRFLPKKNLESFLVSCLSSLRRLFLMLSIEKMKTLGYFSIQRFTSSIISCFQAKPLRSVFVRETKMKTQVFLVKKSLYWKLFFLVFGLWWWRSFLYSTRENALLSLFIPPLHPSFRTHHCEGFLEVCARFVFLPAKVYTAMEVHVTLVAVTGLVGIWEARIKLNCVRRFRFWFRFFPHFEDLFILILLNDNFDLECLGLRDFFEIKV